MTGDLDVNYNRQGVSIDVYGRMLCVMAKKKLPPEVLRFFQDQGRAGGKAGGSLRWKGVPAPERSAIAKKAVAAREAKRAAKKSPLKKPPLR